MPHTNFTLPPMDKMAIEQAGRYGLYFNRDRVTTVGGPSAGVFHDQIFYVCPMKDDSDDAALCVSNLDGGDARVVDRLKGWGMHRACLAVNGCSVLLYYRDDMGREPVLRIVEYETATGQKMGEHKVKADRRSQFTVCCRERTLFFVRGDNLCAYDCGVGASVLYRKAKSIRDLRVWEHYVIFYATYEKQDNYTEGWMAYDIYSGKVFSLDSSLSPEEVLAHPAWFDPDSSAYVENVRQIKIAAFDTARGVYWADLPSRGEGPDVHYWQARSIAKGAVMQDFPVWRFDNRVLSQYRISLKSSLGYFDGERLYLVPTYYKFYSCDPTGNIYEWSASNGGHGRCEQFYVFGDRLFVDMDAHGAKTYPATVQPSAPLGDSWLEAPPPERKEMPFDDWELGGLDGDGWGLDGGGSGFGASEDGGRPGGVDKATVKTLTASDVKYGILTFGTKFDIGQGLSVIVSCQGHSYGGKTSKTVKGRVDGVKALFNDLGLRPGDMLSARYAAAEGVIYLDRIVI